MEIGRGKSSEPLTVCGRMPGTCTSRRACRFSCLQLDERGLPRLRGRQHVGPSLLLSADICTQEQRAGSERARWPRPACASTNTVGKRHRFVRGIREFLTGSNPHRPLDMLSSRLRAAAGPSSPPLSAGQPKHKSWRSSDPGCNTGCNERKC